MDCFLDSSALVKVFHAEAGTPFMVGLLGDPGNSIWLTELARVEFVSAVHRRFRQGEIREEELEGALLGFERQISQFHLLGITSPVLTEAESLLRKFGKSEGLRTLDALQFAAYLLVAGEDWTFVCADRRLCGVVRAYGARVINPDAPVPGENRDLGR